MPTIGDEIMKEADALPAEMAALVDQVADACLDSIRDGSAVTSSLGVPYVEGELYRSWQKRPISATVIEVSSDSPYAMAVEHHATGEHGGGPRSWALTVQHFGRLVSFVVDRRQSLGKRVAQGRKTA